jgi:hypothetical protein
MIVCHLLQIHYGRDDCDTSIQTSIAILIGVVVILVMMMIIITTKRNRKMRVTKQPINFLGSKETYTTARAMLVCVWDVSAHRPRPVSIPRIHPTRGPIEYCS